MKLLEIQTEFRSQVDDQESPYLWSDDEALLYVIDAQDMFVRLTGGISDSTTPALTQLAVAANTPKTAISPYVLRIRMATLLTAGREITMIDEADLKSLRMNDYGWVAPQVLLDSDVGTVQYGILGLDEDSIRWFKVPSTSDTAQLHVYRLPYPRIVDWETVELEIKEQHHRHLIMWMKHLAYSKQDAETRDDKQAAENRAAFEAYCAQAKAEIDRRRFKPRVVRYGGL